MLPNPYPPTHPLQPLNSIYWSVTCIIMYITFCLTYKGNNFLVDFGHKMKDGRSHRGQNPRIPSRKSHKHLLPWRIRHRRNERHYYCRHSSGARGCIATAHRAALPFTRQAGPVRLSLGRLAGNPGHVWEDTCTINQSLDPQIMHNVEFRASHKTPIVDTVQAQFN